MKKLIIVMIAIEFIIIMFLSLGFYNVLKTTRYTYRDKDLPIEFDGFRIAFISDLHCKVLGKNEIKLIRAIESCKPDIVVFTGDMIDSSHMDISSVEALLAGLSGRYPIYTVDGNHEKDSSGNYEKLLKYYKEYGVNDLNNRYLTLTKQGAHIGIYGLSYRDKYFIKKASNIPNKDENKFNILLYHDATAFSHISLYGYNLVLSGHTHGGVIRLPFLGGIINNDGSLFPEYDNGIFHLNGSTLVSNRGIGNSNFPRFYNRSEVVCITLCTSNK